MASESMALARAHSRHVWQDISTSDYARDSQISLLGHAAGWRADRVALLPNRLRERREDSVFDWRARITEGAVTEGRDCALTILSIRFCRARSLSPRQSKAPRWCARD